MIELLITLVMCAVALLAALALGVVGLASLGLLVLLMVSEWLSSLADYARPTLGGQRHALGRDGPRPAASMATYPGRES